MDGDQRWRIQRIARRHAGYDSVWRTLAAVAATAISLPSSGCNTDTAGVARSVKMTALPVSAQAFTRHDLLKMPSAWAIL